MTMIIIMISMIPIIVIIMVLKGNGPHTSLLMITLMILMAGSPLTLVDDNVISDNNNTKQY